jgi:hypothetical protein
MKKAVSDAGLTKAAKAVKPIIEIFVQQTTPATPEAPAATSNVEVSLDTASVGALKAAGADLAVNMGTVKFDVPSEILDQLEDDSLEVASNVVSADTLGDAATAGSEEGFAVQPVSDVYDFSVRGAKKALDFTKVKPKLSIDISNVFADPQKASESHLYAAHVYDENIGRWQYVPSRIVGNDVTFTPPHFSKYTVMKTNVNYEDIQGHWAQETIEQLTANRIVFGETAEKYNPDQAITRAEFAAFLVNLTGLEGEVPGNFKDVSKDAWYYDAVGLAGINGLVSGVGQGNFAPDATVTRQDMAVMLAKAYKLINDEDMNGNAKEFVDTALVSDYAKDAVKASRYHKLIGGFEDGTFQPKKTATRAEAAQMIKALWEQ